MNLIINEKRFRYQKHLKKTENLIIIMLEKEYQKLQKILLKIHLINQKIAKRTFTNIISNINIYVTFFYDKLNKNNLFRRI